MNNSGCHVNVNKNTISSMGANRCADNVRLGTMRHTGPRVRGHISGIVHTVTRSSGGPIVSVRSRNTKNRLGYLSRLIRTANKRVSVDRLPINSPALSTGRVMNGRDRRHVNLLVGRRSITHMRHVTSHRHSPVCIMNRAAGSVGFMFRRTSNIGPVSVGLRCVFNGPPEAVVGSRAIRRACTPIICGRSRLRRCLRGMLRLRTITYGS